MVQGDDRAVDTMGHVLLRSTPASSASADSRGEVEAAASVADGTAGLAEEVGSGLETLDLGVERLRTPSPTRVHPALQADALAAAASTSQAPPLPSSTASSDANECASSNMWPTFRHRDYIMYFSLTCRLASSGTLFK